MTTGPAPYAGWRALAATLLVLAGATCAHAWAGGHVPHWSTLAGLGAVLYGSSLLVLRGHVSWKPAIPVVAVAQAVLHTSFVATTHPGHAGATTSVATDPWTWQMLVAHAAVTVLTVVVWRGCARAASAVLGLLPLPGEYAGGRRDPRPAAGLRAPVRPRLLLGDAPLRGPPSAVRTA